MTATTDRAAARELRKEANRRSRIHGRRSLPYLLVAPAAAYLILFQGVPLLQELRLSLSKTSLLRPNDFNFVGFENFARIFAQEGFVQTLGVTALYVVACVAGTVSLGLGAAILMNREFKGRSVARSLIIIPWAAPPVAVALIAVWMFNAQYGIINRALGDAAPADGVWLDTPGWALAAILIVTIWQLFPFTAVVILAALQAVPTELREASLIDGASPFQQFKAVVWPVITPTVSLLALLMTIWSIRRFELIWLMTQGGPVGSTNTLVIDLYRRSFVLRDLGQGAAVGIVGLVISLVVVVVYFIVSNRAANSKGAL